MKPNYSYAFKDKMATKLTQTDIKTGRIHRCGNCDTACDEKWTTGRFKMVQGRRTDQEKTCFCGRDCANKFARDYLRPTYQSWIAGFEYDIEMLNDFMRMCVDLRRNSKTCFEAIKMVKQNLKVVNMILGGETPQHIVAVEMFKLSEVSMTFAELIGEEEDPMFIAVSADWSGDYSQIDGYNTAMWGRDYAQDKMGCLSIWFE